MGVLRFRPASALPFSLGPRCCFGGQAKLISLRPCTMLWCAPFTKDSESSQGDVLAL